MDRPLTEWPSEIGGYRYFDEAVRRLRRGGARLRLAQALSGGGKDGSPGRKVVFTQHKSASMFIARLLDVVAQILNVPVSSPNLPGCEFLFDEIRLRDHPDELYARTGLIGPLRGFVDCDFDMFDKIVVHLRDPRDVLVSLYFSWAYSHPVGASESELVNPQGESFYVTPELRESWRQAGPDVFALEFSPFIEYNLRLYCDKLISRKNVKVLFYEDLVANPMKWMRAFLLWLGAGEPDLDVFLSILQPVFAPEFAIGVEDHMAHRRQLLPGDHLRKLTAETVCELTRRFSFFLEWRRSFV